MLLKDGKNQVLAKEVDQKKPTLRMMTSKIVRPGDLIRKTGVVKST